MKKEIELEKLDKYLNECYDSLSFEKVFLDYTLLFDNIDDLRENLEEDYRLSVVAYNKGIDKYNSMLDKERGKCKTKNKKKN